MADFTPSPEFKLGRFKKKKACSNEQVKQVRQSYLLGRVQLPHFRPCPNIRITIVFCCNGGRCSTWTCIGLAPIFKRGYKPSTLDSSVKANVKPFNPTMMKSFETLQIIQIPVCSGHISAFIVVISPMFLRSIIINPCDYRQLNPQIS